MRESKGSQKAPVYIVALGSEEIRLIHDLVTDVWMNFPKNVLALQPTRQRLNSIRKTCGEILGIYKKESL